MNPRLPIPGADDGQWGSILNDFLGVSHASNGTLAASSVGTSQLQDHAVTNSQLDAPTQTALSSVADKYTKPSGGIPTSDLDSATQTTLGKVNSAVQTVNSKTPNGSGAVTLAASDVGAAALVGGGDHIYVQANAPSGPTAGDIWFQPNMTFDQIAAAGPATGPITGYDGVAASDLATVGQLASASGGGTGNPVALTASQATSGSPYNAQPNDSIFINTQAAYSYINLPSSMAGALADGGTLSLGAIVSITQTPTNGGNGVSISTTDSSKLMGNAGHLVLNVRFETWQMVWTGSATGWVVRNLITQNDLFLDSGHATPNRYTSFSPELTALGQSMTVQSGTLYLTPIQVDKPITVDYIELLAGATASVGVTHCYTGLYSISGTAWTLVAEGTDTPGAFTAANTQTAVTFTASGPNGKNTYPALGFGGQYAMALLITGASTSPTTPSITLHPGLINNYTMPRSYTYGTNFTTLPAAFTTGSSGMATTSVIPYLALR